MLFWGGGLVLPGAVLLLGTGAVVGGVYVPGTGKALPGSCRLTVSVRVGFTIGSVFWLRGPRVPCCGFLGPTVSITCACALNAKKLQAISAISFII